MAAAITQNAHSPPTADLYPSPAPGAADSSPCTGENRQNAPNASIKAGYQG